MNDEHNIFSNDSITPSQYFDSRRNSNGPHAQERNLMRVVLEDSLDIIKKGWERFQLGFGTASWRRSYQAELDWINDHQADGPFAFDTLCEVMGFDAGKVRLRAIAGQIGGMSRTMMVVSQPKMIEDTSRLRDYQHERSRARRKVMA